MSVSIAAVMSVYNGKPYLRQALESVLAQTRPADEVIVVDNGSTDGSLDVVRAFGGRISLLSETNPGLSHSRNRGMREARGTHVALLDQDDLWHPEKLAAYAEKAAAVPAAALFYSDTVVIDSEGRPYRVLSAKSGPGRLRDVLLRGNVFVSSSAMVRRDSFEQAGPFRTDFQHPAAMGDWEFFLRLARDFPACHIPRPLTYYRVHAAGAIKGNRLKVKADALKVVDIHSGAPDVPAAVRRDAIATVYHESGLRHLAALDLAEARDDFFVNLKNRRRVLPSLLGGLATFLPRAVVWALLGARRLLLRRAMPEAPLR